MKMLAFTLTALLVAIQYPLWLGKGGWVRVWDLDQQVTRQQDSNQARMQRNAALEGEVGDLKQGMGAVEERARYELGMVRPDEVFVQISPASGNVSTSPIAPKSDNSVRGNGVQTADSRTGSAAGSSVRQVAAQR